MRKPAYIFAAVMVVFYFALAYAIAFSPFFASDFSRPVRLTAGTLLFLYALWRGYRLIKETKNRDEQ